MTLPEMQWRQETCDRIFRAGLCVFGVAMVVGAVADGMNGAAKVFFGALSLSPTAKMALLPLGLFAKDWTVLKAPVKEVLLGGILAFGGLYCFADIPSFAYLVPVVFATWIYAARAIYYQGIDVTTGRIPRSGYKFSALSLTSCSE